MTYRCTGCGEPVAGFAGRVPTGLPFSPDLARAMVAESLRRHQRGCPAREVRREAG